MKLSFSTLGCPDFDWAEVYSMATDFGFAGIELRGGDNTLFSLHAKPFLPEHLESTKQLLQKKKLTISCISTDCVLGKTEENPSILDTARAYCDMAKAVGAPFVRLLGERNALYTDAIDDTVVIKALQTLLPYAKERGVTLLLETNGVYADTKRLHAVLSEVHSESIGALWDIHHPYRYADESPEETVQNLGAYIKYVHLKDSVLVDGATCYRMLGEGDLPIDGMMQALSSINYDGYLTLEWLRQYSPELEDAGIVFPHFANYMARFLPAHQQHTRLQQNHAKTGHYIWPKERLIELTFPQLLDRMVQEFPDQPAFFYTTTDYQRTYTEFSNEVDQFARGLIAMGVRPGDHVAIWATNVPEWFLTFWAATKIGAVLVTVNTAYKIHEAEYLLRQSDTHTLVMIDGYRDSDYVGIIKELCPELEETVSGQPLYAKRLPFLRNVITIDSVQTGCSTFIQVLDRADQVPMEEVVRRASNLHPHDVCNMQYTSGTTGFPKGVMLTHYNVINNGKAIGDCMDLSTADRMMIQVPMFHCFGMVLAMTACMTHGSSMFPIPAFSPKLGLDCINTQQITAFHGVPTMFIAMLSHEDFEKTDFSHMRTGIMAGSPCPVKVMQDVVDKMNMNEICITYGQTEASPGCTMSSTTDSLEDRVNTVGGAIFGVECKVVDPETGEELPDNVDGEFVARGYNIMKGYYKMPTATAAAIDKEGWLHTGDLARRTEKGYYKITGRIKDMIIRGGENIYPKEIEDFIYTHPKVQDVQVIGVPSKAYGEEIMACVIVKPEETLTEEEVKTFVLDHMAKHKTPRYVAFVDQFPMNAAGKILKYKMREQAVIDLNLQGADSIETA